MTGPEPVQHALLAPHPRLSSENLCRRHARGARACILPRTHAGTCLPAPTKAEPGRSPVVARVTAHDQTKEPS